MIRRFFFRSLTLFLSLSITLSAPAFALRPESVGDNVGLEEKLTLALRGPRQQPLSAITGLEEEITKLVKSVFKQKNVGAGEENDAVTLSGFDTIGQKIDEKKEKVRTSIGPPSETQGDYSLRVAGSYMDDSVTHKVDRDNSGKKTGESWDFRNRAARSLKYGTGWMVTVGMTASPDSIEENSWKLKPTDPLHKILAQRRKNVLGKLKETAPHYQFRVLLKNGDEQVEVAPWSSPVLQEGPSYLGEGVLDSYQTQFPIRFEAVAQILGRKLETTGGKLPWYQQVANKLLRTDFLPSEKELRGVENLLDAEFIVEVRSDSTAPAAPAEQQAAPAEPAVPVEPVSEAVGPIPAAPALAAASAAPVAKRRLVPTPSRLVVAGTVAGALLLGGAAVITNSLREKPADGTAQPQVVLTSKPAENLPKQGVRIAGEKNSVAKGNVASQVNPKNVQTQQNTPTPQKTVQAPTINKKPNLNAPLTPIEAQQWEYLKRLIDEDEDPRVPDAYVQRFRELLNGPRETPYENIRRFLMDVKIQQGMDGNVVIGDIMNPPGGIPVFPRPVARAPEASSLPSRNQGGGGYSAVQQPSTVRPVRNRNRTARQAQAPAFQDQRPQSLFPDENGWDATPIHLNRPDVANYVMDLGVLVGQRPLVPVYGPQTDRTQWVPNEGAIILNPAVLADLPPEIIDPIRSLLPEPNSGDFIVITPPVQQGQAPVVQIGGGEIIGGGVNPDTGEVIANVIVTNSNGDPVGGIQVPLPMPSTPPTPPVHDVPTVTTPPPTTLPSGGTGTPRGGAGAGAPSRGGGIRVPTPPAPGPGGLEEKSSGAGSETRLDVPAMVGRSSVRVVIGPSALRQMAGLEQAIWILQRNGLQDRVIILPEAGLEEAVLRKRLAEVAVRLLSVPDVAVKGYAAEGDPVMAGLEEMLAKARLPIERGPLVGLRLMVRHILQDLGAPSNDATDQAVKNILSAVGLEEAA